MKHVDPGAVLNWPLSLQYGHGAISQPTYEQVLVQCPDFTNPSTLCNEWLDKVSAEAGPFNGYNLYDDCGPNEQTKTWREHQADKRDRPGTNPRQLQEVAAGEMPDGSGRGFGYPCGKQKGATAWLNDPDVSVADFSWLTENVYTLTPQQRPFPDFRCVSTVLVARRPLPSVR